jgi:succinate-semialdehyde dehydrogenase/glutarate-semialdehyde dehydrogenase
VASFYRVIDEEAAITLTNDSSFGLGVHIYARYRTRKRIADKIDTGMVFINQPTSTADLPLEELKFWLRRELSELGFKNL